MVGRHGFRAWNIAQDFFAHLSNSLYVLSSIQFTSYIHCAPVKHHTFRYLGIYYTTRNVASYNVAGPYPPWVAAERQTKDIKGVKSHHQSGTHTTLRLGSSQWGDISLDSNKKNQWHNYIVLQAIDAIGSELEDTYRLGG